MERNSSLSLEKTEKPLICGLVKSSICSHFATECVPASGTYSIGSQKLSRVGPGWDLHRSPASHGS